MKNIDLKSPNITFSIENEDHTLGNALRTLLVQRKDVVFAGYSVPHPMRAEMNIRIQTTGSPAINVFNESLNELMEICDILTDTFTNASNEFNLEDLTNNGDLALLEYFLQLSFFTTDLHITRAWKLCTNDAENDFKTNSLKEYEGSIVSFWMDMNKMDPPQSFDECVKKGSMNVDLTKQLYETGTIAPPLGFRGNPIGSYRMLLFKVALGRILVHNDESEDKFLKTEIPQSYDSLELSVNSEPKHYNSLYRISDPKQVLLYAAVELEFTAIRIDVPEPVCEMCETAPARWYCHSDRFVYILTERQAYRAHFCNDCDIKQHSTTPIFSRHKRISCSKSPNQFGLCEDHLSETIDMICVKCYTALCSHCILFGGHSDPTFFDHPLMSTLDAYEYSLKKNSTTDELSQRTNFITNRIKNRHNLLSQIYANSLSLQTKIENASKLLIEQLNIMRDKKLRFLDAVSREANTQLLIINWIESFLNHLLLALEPAEFIQCKKRYDLLITRMFGGDFKISGKAADMPIWMLKKLTLTGTTNVRSLSLEQLRLNESDLKSAKTETIPKEWTPLNLYDSWKDEIAHYRDDDQATNDTFADTRDTDILDEKVSNADLDPIEDNHTHKLWHLLSEYKMGTLLHLVKITKVPDRNHLIKCICVLANKYEQLHNLFKFSADFELTAISQNYGHCVLMRSSSTLSDILTYIFTNERSASQESLDWIKMSCSTISKYLTCDDDPKAMARECLMQIVNKLTESMDTIGMPSSLRFVLYFLADLVPQHSTSLCVDMLIGLVFSAYCRLSVSNSHITLESTQQLVYFKEFTTELSFLMGRIGILCWEVPDVSSTPESALTNLLKEWMDNILKKPRIVSKVHVKPPNPSDVHDSTTFIFNKLLDIEQQFNAGKLNITTEESDLLTNKYNLLPLFQLSKQVKI